MTWEYPSAGGDIEGGDTPVTDVGGFELPPDGGEPAETTNAELEVTESPADQKPEPQRVPSTVQRDARQYRELRTMLEDLGATEAQIRGIHQQVKAGTFQGFPQPQEVPAEPTQNLTQDYMSEEQVALKQAILSDLQRMFFPVQQQVTTIASKLQEQEKERHAAEIEETFESLAKSKYPNLKGKLLDAAIREYLDNPDRSPDEIASEFHAIPEQIYQERIKAAKQTASTKTPSITPSGEPKPDLLGKIEGRTAHEKLNNLSDALVRQLAGR